MQRETYRRSSAARSSMAPIAATVRWGAVCAAVALMAMSAAPARADDYDPENSGHPLRILAYVLHPVGVVIDTLIFRPAHFLVSYEPLKTLFGHDPD